MEGEILALIERRDFNGALSRLMRAYGDQIYGFCLQMTREEAIAEDLLQAVFIDAHRALPTYMPKASLRAWLFGIARHRCLDSEEKRRRWGKVVDPRDELPEVPDTAVAADARAGAGEYRSALQDCVDRLPPRVRDTILLRFTQELSYEEMADACGEKLGTLRVRVARALPLLRKCLQQKGIEP